MKHFLRTALLGMAALAGAAAFAQPYPVTISGAVTGCSGNTFVHIATTPGTAPAMNIDVPVDANCGFTTTLSMQSDSGTFIFSTACQGTTQTQTATYAVDPAMPDSNFLWIPFNCGGQTMDCLGVPGGSALPGTACTTLLGTPGMWDGNCQCIVDSSSCQACFTMQATNPFSALFISCTTGVVDSLLWDFSGPGGGAVTGNNIPHTFLSSGMYSVCLNAFINGGIACQHCQTVWVDSAGNVTSDTQTMDCLGVPGGSALPGSACTTLLGMPGIWDGNCQCIADSSTCHACFTITSPAPWTANFINCSYGGSSSYTYSWWLPNGSSSSSVNENWTFTGAGMFGVCLTMADGNGCTNVLCDTVYVDANGNIDTNPLVMDCLGVTNGPNMPGTPCTTPTGNPGTWNLNCTCISAPDSSGCQACFTVTQSAPFTGIFTNCTTGGTPPYQVAWAFNATDTVYGSSTTHVFTGPGSYTVCIAAMGADMNWCYTCQNVLVDSTGTINANASTACHAGFWAIQAYDSAYNTTPIPNVVWVLNLSSGGSGTYQFLWSFGDGTSSTDAYPTHEYSGPGPWNLCLTLTDSEGCTSNYCDSVSVDENGLLHGLMVAGHHNNAQLRSNGFTLNVIHAAPTGIAELPSVAELNAWPNPAQAELNISFNKLNGGEATVSVIDPLGRTVLSEVHNFPAGANRLRMDTGSLEPGLYLLHVGSGTSVLSHRFLKVQ